MNVHESTVKRQRQTKRRRARNQAILSGLKTALKKAKSALNANDPQAAQQAVGIAISALDRAASKKVIHKNKASRTVSRMSRRSGQLLRAASTNRSEPSAGAAS